MFANAEESLEYLYWRNDQYFNYLNLMPLTGHDGKVILDFGCGPGHDLVGFSTLSKPRTLYGYDVSQSSLAQAQHRLAFHSDDVKFIQGNPGTKIPLPDASVDMIHSSGVLHHLADLQFALQELRRILKPDGYMQVMVYNYNSLWVHLYVAYIWQIIEQKYTRLTIKEAFAKSTDGENCPVSNVYTPECFLDICRANGFDGKFRGTAISMHEAKLCSQRYNAIQNLQLGREHREFLMSLTFDEYGFPMYKGYYAGIDACYELWPTRQ